jgi:hypothetical protein
VVLLSWYYREICWKDRGKKLKTRKTLKLSRLIDVPKPSQAISRVNIGLKTNVSGTSSIFRVDVLNGHVIDI